MTNVERGRVLWSPPDAEQAVTRTESFAAFVRASGIDCGHTYRELWNWSVSDLDAFWATLATYFAVDFETPPERVLGTADGSHRDLPDPLWFPGATLNYASHALHPRGVEGNDIALVCRSQTVAPTQLTWDDLRARVAAVRGWMRSVGVQRGDRVVAYLPNGPEAVIAFLAAAGLGAIWSSCPPEFGAKSVVDRFSQIEPTVLFAVDGYRYGSRSIDRSEALASIIDGLPTLRHVVRVPYLNAPPPDSATVWGTVLAHDPDPAPAEPLPFDHPLYVLYSSGTTGLPKAIVHGHGGILLEHLKALGLHANLGPGSRFFWYSTTGWMMWNLLVSGLCVGATVVTFDGDPGHPDLDTLWSMADETETTFFGVSAPFLHACAKAHLEPRAHHRLSDLEAVGSTGAPLSPAGFEWVHAQVSSTVPIASISGGTDVCTAFLGHDRMLAVRSGELAGPYLGVKVAALDDAGEEVVGQQGELVVTAPMPSMPVAFWGDADGSRRHAAYFESHPGMWHHGDWITVYDDGAAVISGRSDATLNRGGVRLGTSDFYAVVDALPEVADSLVVHLEDPEGGLGTLILFVKLTEGTDLDEGLRTRIVSDLRSNLSPRHAPDVIRAVPGIPRTLSGKRLEVPVKRILGGADPTRAASRDSLADPTALDWFAEHRSEFGAR